jgi:hypothetical protein
MHPLAVSRPVNQLKEMLPTAMSYQSRVIWLFFPMFYRTMDAMPVSTVSSAPGFENLQDIHCSSLPFESEGPHVVCLQGAMKRVALTELKMIQEPDLGRQRQWQHDAHIQGASMTRRRHDLHAQKPQMEHLMPEPEHCRTISRTLRRVE